MYICIYNIYICIQGMLLLSPLMHERLLKCCYQDIASNCNNRRVHPMILVEDQYSRSSTTYARTRQPHKPR